MSTRSPVPGLPSPAHILWRANLGRQQVSQVHVKQRHDRGRRHLGKHEESGHLAHPCGHERGGACYRPRPASRAHARSHPPVTRSHLAADSMPLGLPHLPRQTTALPALALETDWKLQPRL